MKAWALLGNSVIDRCTIRPNKVSNSCHYVDVHDVNISWTLLTRSQRDKDKPAVRMGAPRSGYLPLRVCTAQCRANSSSITCINSPKIWQVTGPLKALANAYLWKKKDVWKKEGLRGLNPTTLVSFSHLFNCLTQSNKFIKQDSTYKAL